MGLEVASWVNQLVSTNPIGASDPKSQGDDHIRLIKAALVASFPNIGGAMNASHTELNYSVGVTSLIQTQLNGKAASSHTHGNGDLTGYTAADVLAKILTVDGAGSNLDADLLDGQSSAFYRDAGNINAGTLASARGGTGQTSDLAAMRTYTLQHTIQADPGGTPSGSPGDVFEYY